MRENFFLLRKNSEARNPFGLRASFTPCLGVARKGEDGWQLSTLPRRSCGAAETGLAGRLFPYGRGFVLRSAYWE